MTIPLQYLVSAAAAKGRVVLYTIGDNEVTDCHRHASWNKPADIYSASAARNFFVTSLNLNSGRDLTGAYHARQHVKNATIPGTANALRYSCDFDKYVAFDWFAAITMEVPGSFYYLADETASYAKQNVVDPLAGRFWMHLNAIECALEWLEMSAARASSTGKRVLFVTFQALFYTDQGTTAASNKGIGTYYSAQTLLSRTLQYANSSYSQPYQPLFAKLTSLGIRYPSLQFVVVHSDGHKLSMNRMNPTLANQGLDPGKLFSNHNVMLHMVEGDSKALTMYSKFIVSGTDFYPVTYQQRWSKAAYDTVPLGHSRIPY
jgi:hypothetical protein